MIGMVLGAVLAPLALQAAPAARVNVPLSPAGQAVAKKYLGSPDPQAQAIARQMQASAGKVRALAAAPKLNMAQLAALIGEQQRLQAALRKRSDDRVMAMLDEMGEADRLAFVRGMTAPRQPAGAPPR
jgi:hypothetical protein